MKRLIGVLVLIVNVAYAQNNTISLKDCYEGMLETYPLVKQMGIYESSTDLNMKNIQSGWLPNAEFNAQATYQSDAMEVSISAMGNTFGFESEKDQYKATVDINQLIYDWGRIKKVKQLEQSNLKLNQQNTKVELNKIKEQVNKFYFAILILDHNEQQLYVMLNDLKAKQESVESAVINGVLLKSDLSALKAEILKIDQSINEIKNQRIAAINILNEITGLEINTKTKFDIPVYDVSFTEEIIRPEITLFDLQQEKLDVSSGLISKQTKPTVFAFGQLGYGKPGLNMANDEFDSFYYIGMGLRWNFWDWNKTKREKQVISLNKDLVITSKNAFTTQVNVALHNEKARIMNYEDAIEADKEIIRLREEVSESARSKLDNGVITSTDYITELGKETQAKINYETHKIQLIQSKVNYLYIKGEI